MSLLQPMDEGVIIMLKSCYLQYTIPKFNSQHLKPTHLKLQKMATLVNKCFVQKKLAFCFNKMLPSYMATKG